MPLHLPRRRTLAKVGLFLLAGAVVNVVVAWGLFGVEWRRTAANGIAFHGVRPMHAVAGPNGWGSPVNQLARHATGVDWRWDIYLADDQGGAVATEPRVNRALSVCAGFPMRSLRAVALSDADDQPKGTVVTPVVSRYVGGWPLDPGRHWLMLPYGVMPLGFAVNTVAYGGLLLLAAFAWRAIVHRRSRRLARGLCPRCKYAIADLPTCPECGETIRRKAAIS
jgi:hypothetical protein